MTLIKCPMCEKEISPNAESCPNCGEPMKKKITKKSDLYNVILLNAGNARINMIHQIRKITNCELKEAKDSVDNVPSIIIKEIDYSRTIDYKNLFEGLGATIEILPVSTDQKFNDFIKQDFKNNHALSIKCSNCGSINVKKISGASKVGSVVLFGVFSMGKITKTYECNKCGYRW